MTKITGLDIAIIVNTLRGSRYIKDARKRVMLKLMEISNSVEYDVIENDREGNDLEMVLKMRGQNTLGTRRERAAGLYRLREGGMIKKIKRPINNREH